MFGLAKIALDYEKLYADNPDLDQLRLNEIAAREQYEKDEAAYKSVRNPEVIKGLTRGFGIGGGIGLIPGALARKPEYATAGSVLGGLLGAATGGEIADIRMEQSPLYLQKSESRKRTSDAEDAHMQRWWELAYPEE